MIQSLCTFSRAFAEYAKADLEDIVFNDLVKENLARELIGHISRDARAIPAREKALNKAKVTKVPEKRGRPSKSEVREPVAEKR
jgi:hypothetical protein